MSRPTCRNFPVLFAFLCLLGISTLHAEVTVCDLEQPPHFATPTPEFFAAAATGNLAQLQQSLDEGIAVDAAVPTPLPPEMASLFTPRSRGGLLLNDPGATALMLATATGRTEVVTALLAAKANREARTRSGIRPLDIAAERNDTETMQLLLGVTPASDAAHLSIAVNLATQRATLSRDGQPVLETKVSSGKKEKPTPPGKYVVTQKYTEWHSSLYHNASMPFFLRLSCSPVGLHAGVVMDHPASHGCVRLPAEIARKFYEIVPKGTLVVIQ